MNLDQSLRSTQRQRRTIIEVDYEVDAFNMNNNPAMINYSSAVSKSEDSFG